MGIVHSVGYGRKGKGEKEKEEREAEKEKQKEGERGEEASATSSEERDVGRESIGWKRLEVEGGVGMACVLKGQ